MQREELIYRRYLDGRTFEQIAQELGVSRDAVTAAIDRASDTAEGELDAQADRLWVEQTFQLKRLLHEALDAWDRSKQAEEVTKVSTEAGRASGKKKAEKTIRAKVGDPRFLQLAASVLASLRELSGVEGARKQAPPASDRAVVIEDKDWYEGPSGPRKA